MINLYSWAQKSLRLHENDAREYIYTRSQFEEAATHDELWNAAQLEMVHKGKMAGFADVLGQEDFGVVARHRERHWEPYTSTTGMSLTAAIEWVCWLHPGNSGPPRSRLARSCEAQNRYMNYAGCKRKFNVTRHAKSQGWSPRW